MNYLKHPYSIEAKMVKKYGETYNVECAGYILEDGTLINMSYNGIQRDEDHNCVGEFFENIQGAEAMYRFMKRGNVRVMCNRSFYGFEYIKEPTEAQRKVITKAMNYAYRNGITFYVDETTVHKSKWSDRICPSTKSVIWEIQ